MPRPLASYRQKILEDNYEPVTWTKKIDFNWRHAPRPRAKVRGQFGDVYDEPWYLEYLSDLSNFFDQQTDLEKLRAALESPYGFNVTLIVNRHSDFPDKAFLREPDVDNIAKGIIDALMCSKLAQTTHPLRSKKHSKVTDRRMVQLLIRKQYTSQPSSFVISVTGEGSEKKQKQKKSGLKLATNDIPKWSSVIDYNWRHTPRPRVSVHGKFGVIYNEPWYDAYLTDLSNIFNQEKNLEQLSDALTSKNGFNVSILVNRHSKNYERPFLNEPDVDNIAKAIVDALMKTDVAQNSHPIGGKKGSKVTDGRMVQLLIRKQYTEKPSHFKITVKGE